VEESEAAFFFSAARIALTSKAPRLIDHFTDAPLAGFDPLSQCPHSLDDFLVREFVRRLCHRDQQCCGNPMPCNGDCFASRNAVQQVRKVRLGLECSYGCHSFLQYN
jgi:hypothetical protein